MPSLIQTLNENVGKTPDQIVTFLKHGGWIKGSDMTLAQYNALVAGPERGHIRLTEYHGSGSWWEGGVRPNGGYHMNAWSLGDVSRNLHNYYFIAFDDYRPGMMPPIPEGRT